MANEIIIPNKGIGQVEQSVVVKGVQDTIISPNIPTIATTYPQATEVFNVLNRNNPYEMAIKLLTKIPDKPQPITQPELTLPTPIGITQETYGTSYLGAPIYSNLQIDGNTYIDMQTGKQISFEAVNFDSVLLTIEQSKEIIETKISGADYGAVLEYSGLNNYTVTATIIITSNNNGIFPQSTIENFIKMLKSPLPLVVNSWYLSMYDINQLTVFDYKDEQKAGGISQVEFNITFHSTQSVNLIIQ